MSQGLVTGKVARDNSLYLREYTGKLNDETLLWSHIFNPEKTLFLRLSSYYTQKYKNPRGVEDTVKCSTSLSSFSSTHVKKKKKQQKTQAK